FPLNDLDYESSPAGLAQELSNLQAIRRMSMDVHTTDPDLPSFQSYASPPVSPPALSDDDDANQLFWVPARLHPELAPKEFKTFIEEKVHTIRRRSGDLSSSLSPDGSMGRQDSSGGLRRKKSMLSRQIDTGSGYKDGAERLERKRSGTQPNGGLSNLQELEHIVEDPAAMVRRMSMSRSPTPEALDGDAPIIPGGMGGGLGTLKRSTRTTYRRGSLRSQGRVPLSRRLVSRNAETDTEDSPATSPTHPDVPELPKLPHLNRVQSEPINGAFEPSNFSRPNRRPSPTEDEPQRPGSAEPQTRPESAGRGQEERKGPQPKAFHSRIASNGRTSAFLPGYNAPQPQLASPVPQIIETPPPQEPERKQPYQLPERTTSRQPPQPHPQPQQQRHAQQQQQQQPGGPRSQAQPHLSQQPRQSPSVRQNKHAQAAQNSPIKPQQSLDDLTQHPSPIPGSHNTRVDNLSIIPNLPVPDDKKDKKSKDKKEEAPRKTSWGWLVGNDKKEKEKEDREKEAAKKVKNKLSKPQDKADDTRLDLLQSSMQGGNRGRESVVLDRDNVKLEEERKKESARKASGDKKEKEPGLLSSIFGGGKKKGEKESSHKKNASRGLSPEPPPRILKPDIDYNWTRFSILEERAIYRMAHIKLANPRRELYSQVLLSNFMYSYLAKVQQMHPQIQIGNSKQAKLAVAQQKKEQQQQQQQQQAQPQQAQQQQQPQQQQQQQQQQQPPQQQQPEEFSQYQRYQQVSSIPARDLSLTDNPQQQQQQEQPEKSNEWPSAYAQQDAGQHNGYQQQQHSKYGQSPRDSHHSQHSVNGGGYSVSNSSNYLGQPVKQGHGPPDSDKSGDDDMW
ncbi:hypothetical protein N0V95_009665, partial [Ascochyta clinopodiicola]